MNVYILWYEYYINGRYAKTIEGIYRSADNAMEAKKSKENPLDYYIEDTYTED